MSPEEVRILETSKQEMLESIENWISCHPKNKQKKLKWDMISGIFEMGRKSVKPYSITFQSSTLIVNEAPATRPNYTKQ